MSAKASGIRDSILDPLAHLPHEEVSVTGAEGKYIVRALSAGDWADYRAAIVRAREAAGIGDETHDKPLNLIPATALVLARCVYGLDRKRVFTDSDVPAIAASFAGVHGELCDKAFKLSGVVGTEDPVAEAGNA